MNVLSLFDGISCGQLALQRAGIKYDNYFASEIDKYTLAVTQHHYPNTIQLGDITNWQNWNLPPIDLLMGGSPCQGFSCAGKRLNFDDPRSKLFFDFADILKYCQPQHFLLENVRMSQRYQDIISKILDVQPIVINSALVSAQNRKRLYWTNMLNIMQPIDTKAFWSDIQIDNADGVFYYTKKSFDWIFHDARRATKYFEYSKDTNVKMQTLEASHYKGYSNQRCFGINDNGKTRYIHPIECERLQTIPDNYTLVRHPTRINRMMSRTQRYKMLGNAWTVDIIAHILRGIK